MSRLKKLMQPTHMPRQEGPATRRQSIMAAALNDQYQEMRAAHQLRQIPGADLVDTVPHANIPAELKERVGRINHRFRTMPDAEMGASVRRAYSLIEEFGDGSDATAAKVMSLALKPLANATGFVVTGDIPAARKAVVNGADALALFLLSVINTEVEAAKTETEVWVAETKTELAGQLVDTARELEADRASLAADRAALEAERTALETERAAFEDEKGLLIAAADAANAEASEARRIAAQAKEDKQAAEERHRKNSEFNRNQAAAEVREARERLSGVQEALNGVRTDRDRLAAQVQTQATALAEKDALIAELQAQLAERAASLPMLSSQEAEPKTPLPEQADAQTLLDGHTFDSQSDAISFRTYLELHGQQGKVEGRVLSSPTATVADLNAWAAAYPTRQDRFSLVVAAKKRSVAA